MNGNTPRLKDAWQNEYTSTDYLVGAGIQINLLKNRNLGLRLDYAVLGISAVDADGVLLEHDYREARVAQGLIRNARCRMLVAEGVKFERTAMTRVASLADMSVVVSDRPMPAGLAQFDQLSWITATDSAG
ncbi:MAG: hypothetical protein ACPGUF_01665 [Litorivicinus sp.]